MILDIYFNDFLDIEQVGNKALVLNKLHKLKYNVCQGYILPHEIFEKFCFINEIQITDEKITDKIISGRYNNNLYQALYNIFNKISNKSGAVIVRSSSTEEDSYEKSCAGMFESIPDIKTFADMLIAIKKVWCSYFIENDNSQLNKRYPIIIQEMLYCDKSGIIFTQNPVNNKDEVLIEACKGNNQNLINNIIKPDRHILSRKEKNNLIDLSLKIESDMGYPCDIEWGMKDKKIYIFQTRPIVSTYDKEIYTAIRDNSADCILLDRYANPAAVCYLSLLEGWQNRVYLNYYNRKKGNEFDEKPLHFINNRVYWNAKYQKKYFEDAGKDSLVKKVKLYFLIKTSYKNWYKRLPNYDQNIRTLEKDTELSKDYKDLLKILDRTIDNFCDYLGVDHFRFLGLAQILYNKLFSKVKDNQDEVSKAIAEKTNKNKTIQSNNELLFITREIKINKQLLNIFYKKSPEELLKQIYENEEYYKVKKYLNKFIIKHGHRGIDCDDLYYPHWNEDPCQIIKLIKQLLKSKIPLIEETGKCTFIKENKVRKLADITGIYMCLREDQRYYFDKSWSLLRKIILKLAEYYIEKQTISDKQDIFHMKIDEIRSGIKYRNYIISKEIVDHRKYNYNKQKNETPPYIIKNSEEISIQKDSGHKSYKVMGISGGAARGKIKIINSLDDIGSIETNDIGVVKTFHPSWTPILKIVSGLIMNYGNMLSHGAVVAREYNIPVVVFNADATKILSNGNIVEINGTNGRLKILKENK